MSYTIKVVGTPSGSRPDDGMMKACFSKVVDHQGSLIEAIIVCDDRVPDDAPDYKHPGWLEFSLQMKYEGGHNLYMGAIQRTKDANIEFHS